VSDGSTTAEWKYEHRALDILRMAAILGDSALFLATHQELSTRQRRGRAATSMARHLQTLTPERLAELALELIDDDTKEQAPPLEIAHPAGDDAPDGEDTSAFAVWLRRQLEG
jgi:hypothetical protein